MLEFEGDSDAHIVRGLVAIMLALFSGKRASEILRTDAEATMHEFGLDEHLTPQRANGLRSMVKRIKREAAGGTRTYQSGDPVEVNADQQIVGGVSAAKQVASQPFHHSPNEKAAPAGAAFDNATTGRSAARLALAAEAHLLGKLRAGRRIVRCDHRIACVQAPLLAVLVRASARSGSSGDASAT